MNKIIPILIVGFLILNAFGAVALTTYQKSNEIFEFKSCVDDLDQFQTVLDDGIPVGNFQLPENPRYNWTVAQSFTPTKSILTRIQLLIGRNTMPPTVYPLTMVVRKTLTGENLAIFTINPEEVLEFPDNSWIKFDFVDIPVTPSETYYIVCYTVNETDNGYVWGIATNNLYENGQVYFSFDNGVSWESNPPADTSDMCFKTYGRDTNQPPYPPSIEGPLSGKPDELLVYDFYTADPEGDDMDYYVDWGDECVDDGFVPSGGGMTLSHTWTERGSYTIKAKLIDTFGAESDWAILEVELPKNKIKNQFFETIYQIFEQITILKKII